jgi:hypothetical protein
VPFPERLWPCQWRIIDQRGPQGGKGRAKVVPHPDTTWQGPRAPDPQSRGRRPAGCPPSPVQSEGRRLCRRQGREGPDRTLLVVPTSWDICGSGGTCSAAPLRTRISPICGMEPKAPAWKATGPQQGTLGTGAWRVPSKAAPQRGGSLGSVSEPGLPDEHGPV